MGLSIILLVIMYCILYFLKTWHIFDLEKIKFNQKTIKSSFTVKKFTKDAKLNNIFNRKIQFKGKESCVIHFNG